jgi:lysophospholipase L1-like esterase
VLAEIVGLVWLYFSVGSYKHFWQEKAKQPGQLTYIALGDSAAQGIGATSSMRGYVGLIAKQLAAQTGKTVRVVNVSVTGATIEDLLKDQLPQIKGMKADVVTVEIGANDIKSFNKTTFTREFAQMLTSLPKGTYVSNMPLFNSRPGSSGPAKEASQIIERELVGSSMHFVDLQKQTTEHQSIFGFAPDLFHPNNLSYKNWYTAFWSQIDKNLPN